MGPMSSDQNGDQVEHVVELHKSFNNEINLPEVKHEDTSRTCSVTERKQLIKKDSGYAWVIVFGSFTAYSIYTGTASVIGIIQVEYEKLIPGSSAPLTSLNALINGLPFLLSPLITALSRVVSCRLLSIIGGLLCSLGFFVCFFTTSVPLVVLCIGVLPGIGFGMIFLPSTIMAGKCFSKKAALAMTIGVWGGGFGVVAFPPLFTYLLQTFGFKGSLMICSAIYMHGVVIGVLYLSSSTDNKDHVDNLKDAVQTLYDTALVKKKHFVPSMTSYLFLLMSYYIPFIYLPVKSYNMGISLDLTSALISATGACSVAGRIVCGSVTAKSEDRRIVCVFLAEAVFTLSHLTFALSDSFVVLMIGACIFGFTSGTLISLGPALMLDLFGVGHLPSSLGLHYMTCGIGGLIAGPLTSFITHELSDDGAAFYVPFVCSLFGTLLFIRIVLSYFKLKLQSIRQSLRNENDISSADGVFVISIKPSGPQAA